MEFDPDRFLDDRLQKYLTPNPFIFLPFNAGPLICLGQQFAYNEISFFLVRLLQNFSDVQLDFSAQPPESRPPQEWIGAEGQKGVEKIIPRCLLTLYLEVRKPYHMASIHDGHSELLDDTGRPVGQND